MVSGASFVHATRNAVAQVAIVATRQRVRLLALAHREVWIRSIPHAESTLLRKSGRVEDAPTTLGIGDYADPLGIIRQIVFVRQHRDRLPPVSA